MAKQDTGRAAGGPRGGRAAVGARELELKFEVPDGFVVPDLAGLADVTAVDAAAEHQLDATYLDTRDLRLLRRDITLRRRTGGTDAGWHLKLPRPGDGGPTGAARDRDELRLPATAGGRAVPAELVEQVRVHLRGQELEPVLRLRTRRRTRLLRSASGVALAELALDRVSAAVPAPDGSQTSVSTWTELELELLDGDPALLSRVAKRLRRAGARPARSGSKPGRALADRLAALGAGPQPAVALPRPGSAGAVVLDHLRGHVERLIGHDAPVRADAPDAVHQMRVATRRLRSALATFRPVLDRELTDPLREELRWLGEVLGAARDAEVIRDHLLALAAAEPPELVVGPFRERIADTLHRRHRAAHDAVLAALDTPRYFALLDRLEQLLERPPFTDRAAAGADTVLLPRVAAVWERMVELQRAAADLGPAGSPQARDEALHALRKAAKRARYAAEALSGRYGRPARRWAGLMEALQETLGAHQDTVVIRHTLDELAAAARAAGEDTFGYGRLHALEQARAAATERDHRPAWDAAGDPRRHRWLRRP